jgi:hypothetical protein
LRNLGNVDDLHAGQAVLREIGHLTGLAQEVVAGRVDQIALGVRHERAGARQILLRVGGVRHHEEAVALHGEVRGRRGELRVSRVADGVANRRLDGAGVVIAGAALQDQ